MYEMEYQKTAQNWMRAKRTHRPAFLKTTADTMVMAIAASITSVHTIRVVWGEGGEKKASNSRSVSFFFLLSFAYLEHVLDLMNGAKEEAGAHQGENGADAVAHCKGNEMVCCDHDDALQESKEER
jgi:hypothetical protein